MTRRIGVDIGGTFTDIVLDADGVLHSTKLLTDHAAPERAIATGVKAVAATAGIDPGSVDLLIHGTTLATNALIERRGAKTAFITTQGFRDVLEMRTESRFEQYDLNIVLPSPLIERRHRYVLRERIDASGRVLVSPDPAEIAALADKIAAGGYESVAIGFMHAYVSGAHERLMRDALLQRLPNLSISISSDVSPQMREFERFNTVCANAYVKPAMASYLERLTGSMRDIGVRCPVFIMHSGGGIISIETAAEFPVRLVESGPAGGAIFAADIARRHGIEAALSFDMGGTTAKICLIEHQIPKTAKTFEVARAYRFKKGSGMPISIPVVEMVEIGAGGGSIARIDGMKQIRVGPHSAGSEPGPASYQRGGTSPTVTDADLILGRLDPHNFAGGDIALSTERASDALKRDVGATLSLDAETAAHGVCEVVDENMANAGRVHAVENGKDISAFTMITFGGAGPLHAARLCEKMGIARYLVPPGAGVGSAIGFLRAPFGYEAARSTVVRLSAFKADAANALMDSMAQEATGFVREGLRDATPILERTAFMRYVGQGWEIPVALPARPFETGDVAVIGDLFAEAYTRFFGRPVEGLDVEIVSWSVRATSPLPPVARVAQVEAKSIAAPQSRRRIFDANSKGFIDSAIHERSALRTGDRIDGPAIVVERETSTVVSSGWRAIAQADGCLLISKR